MADEEMQQDQGDAPNEEELRAQLEEEIRKVRVQDVVLQSVVSILNLSARRIAKDDERDLDQAKLGIDAAGALLEFVEEDAQAQLKQAISELQLLYAKYAGGDGGDEGGGDQGSGAEQKPPERPGGDSGLWTPPSS